MRLTSQLALAAVLVWALLPAHAEKVRANLPSGLGVSADYRAGDTSRPALMVLHGFLQTNEFQATRNIIEGLAGLGYAVLSPNLSLGVADRRKSLPCQALHKHTVSGDVAEIDFWVDWLVRHGQKRIILVGHSWGGQHALAYMQAHPKGPVTGIVAVSLVRARQSAQTVAEQAAAANAMLDSETPGLKRYELNFCREFAATPQSYLSYASWTDDKVLASLKDLPVPVYVILGGNDRRSDESWRTALAASGATVAVVPGADHFFSSLYEFDLVDAMQAALHALDSAD